MGGPSRQHLRPCKASFVGTAFLHVPRGAQNADQAVVAFSGGPFRDLS